MVTKETIELLNDNIDYRVNGNGETLEARRRIISYRHTPIDGEL